MWWPIWPSPSPGWARKVLVLDADLGLANIDVLLGLTPQYTIQHLLNRAEDGL